MNGSTTLSISPTFNYTVTLAQEQVDSVITVSLKVTSSTNARTHTVYRTITIKRDHQSQYFVKDHLGSPRVVVDGKGAVLSHTDYYPFGMVMPGRAGNFSLSNDRVKFTGYLLEEEGGQDTYHAEARGYDPVIGRFTSRDPMNDKYPGWSPYNYTLNNPIRNTDPTGLCVIPGMSLFCIGMHKGVEQTVTSSYEGVKNLITDFPGTMSSLGQAIANPGETLSAIGEGLDTRVDMATSGNPMLIGQVVGEALAITGEVLLGSKGAGAVAKSARVADSAADVAGSARRASPKVQNVLDSMADFEAGGGTIKINPLNPAQELNMTFQKGTQKMDFRIESHPLPKGLGGDGVTPIRHMNVDLYPNKKALPNSGHKVLE